MQVDNSCAPWRPARSDTSRPRTIYGNHQSCEGTQIEPASRVSPRPQKPASRAGQTEMTHGSTRMLNNPQSTAYETTRQPKRCGRRIARARQYRPEHRQRKLSGYADALISTRMGAQPHSRAGTMRALRRPAQSPARCGPFQPRRDTSQAPGGGTERVHRSAVLDRRGSVTGGRGCACRQSAWPE